MNKKVSELQKEFINNLYRELIDVFYKFISNDDQIYDYNYKFDLLKIEDVHQKTINDMFQMEELKKIIKEKMFNLKDKINKYKSYQKIIPEKVLKKYNFFEKIINDKDIAIYDYYFIYNNNYYTLNMSSDFYSFGYDSEYFKEVYPNDYHNFVCCELSNFNNYIEFDNTKSVITFIFDIEKKCIIEILNINYYEEISNKKNIVCINDDKTLKKIL